MLLENKVLVVRKMALKKLKMQKIKKIVDVQIFIAIK